jgi:glutamate synthase domain-containing protein 3
MMLNRQLQISGSAVVEGIDACGAERGYGYITNGAVTVFCATGRALVAGMRSAKEGIFPEDLEKDVDAVTIAGAQASSAANCSSAR